MTAAVILAAGHGRLPNGGWDKGTTYKLLEEHALNKIAMFACYDALKAGGVDVKMERGSTRNTEDRLDGNWVRFRSDLNSVPAGVRLAVEFHHDWHRAARGGFGIWSSSAFYAAHREKAACAAMMLAYLAAGLPTRPSYGDRRGLGLLRRPKCPTIIWECDRLGDIMTSPGDAGRACAAGIAAYLAQ